MTDTTRPARTRKRSGFANLMVRLFREKPLGAFGLVIAILLLLTGIFADFLAPYGMNEVDTARRLEPPSQQYLLGTDNLGRDLLSRVIYGARVSMVVGLGVSAIATLISVTVGMLSGYIGGTFDLIIQRIVDAFMSLPMLILLLAIISMIGQGMLPLILVMGLTLGIGGARHSRGFVLSIMGNPYLQAARVTGCRTGRILVRHVLPNIAAPLIVGFTVLLPGVILTESALSFLGYGVPPPQPSWGAMLSGTNRSYMFLAPWMVIWPGLALTLVVWGTHMLGDALRDLLDPRLRGGIGRYGRKQTVASRGSLDGESQSGHDKGGKTAGRRTKHIKRHSMRNRLIKNQKEQE